MRHIKFILLSAIMTLGFKTACAQIATNMKISEVVVDNRGGLVDEYGNRSGWIEICNTSWGTVNLRSCYLTTDRRTLNEELSVPERVKLMSLIPKGDERTELNAQERLVFHADGQQNLGTVHTAFKLVPGKDNFIALFDGNGHTLLDSVTVPASLKADESYARFFSDDGKTFVWKTCSAADVTPGSDNNYKGGAVNKVAQFKEKDPYGLGMTILGMGIVFACLVLLAVFFTLFGKIFAARDKRNAQPQTVAGEEPAAVEPADNEGEVAAVISLALRKALYDLHDNESGVLTIKHHRTNWTRTGNSNK